MSEAPSTPPTCCKCGYDLAGSISESCPECGGNIEVERARRGPPKPTVGVLICLWIGGLLWIFGAMAIEGFSRVYTGARFSPDPISIVIHVLAVGVSLGAVAATLGRRGLRFATQGWFSVIAFAAGAQLLLWILALVMLVR